MIVYKITNKINGKSYIGQTTRRLSKRWWEHQKGHTNSILKLAIVKYGKDSFSLETLAVATNIDLLNSLEEAYIESFETMAPSGYNLKTGGLNCTYSKTSREKMSRSAKGRIPWNKGKSGLLSEESRRKISEGQLGRKRGPISEVTRERMSMAAKGRMRPVIAWSATTSWYFRSVSEASKFGFQHSNIFATIKGRKKQYKGFFWRFYETDK